MTFDPAVHEKSKSKVRPKKKSPVPGSYLPSPDEPGYEVINKHESVSCDVTSNMSYTHHDGDSFLCFVKTSVFALLSGASVGLHKAVETLDVSRVNVWEINSGG